MRNLILALVLVVGCGDGGEPATRVDATGGAGGEAAPVGGAPGTGFAGAAAGGHTGTAGAPAATGGVVGTGGVTATGGSGTGGRSSPSCLIPISQISGPATISLVAGYITGGGTNDEMSRCSQQAVTDSSLMSPVIGGVPSGPTGWVESSYMVALHQTYDCEATITYVRAGSGPRACNELVTLKVIVTP